LAAKEKTQQRAGFQSIDMSIKVEFARLYVALKRAQTEQSRHYATNSYLCRPISINEVMNEMQVYFSIEMYSVVDKRKPKIIDLFCGISAIRNSKTS
jgi:hypothetical protein